MKSPTWSGVRWPSIRGGGDRSAALGRVCGRRGLGLGWQQACTCQTTYCTEAAEVGLAVRESFSEPFLCGPVWTLSARAFPLWTLPVQTLPVRVLPVQTCTMRALCVVTVQTLPVRGLLPVVSVSKPILLELVQDWCARTRVLWRWEQRIQAVLQSVV